MNPKEIILKYRAVGYVQLFPVLVSLVFIVWTTIAVIIVTFAIPSLYPGSNPSSQKWILLTIFILISLSLISGLISFLVSSFQFIKSKKNEDYERLVKGMAYLNGAWLMLSLFTIAITTFFSYIIFSIIKYGYF